MKREMKCEARGECAGITMREGWGCVWGEGRESLISVLAFPFRSIMKTYSPVNYPEEQIFVYI